MSVTYDHPRPAVTTDVVLFSNDDLPSLAFDHAEIIAEARKRL